MLQQSSEGQSAIGFLSTYQNKEINYQPVSVGIRNGQHSNLPVIYFYYYLTIQIPRNVYPKPGLYTGQKYLPH